MVWCIWAKQPAIIWFEFLCINDMIEIIQWSVQSEMYIAWKYPFGLKYCKKINPGSLQTLVRTQVTTYTWCAPNPLILSSVITDLSAINHQFKGKIWIQSVFQTLPLPSWWWLLYAVLIKQLNLHLPSWEDTSTRADLSLWIASLSHYEAAALFPPWTFKTAETEMLCDSEWNNFDVTRNVIKTTAVF